MNRLLISATIGVCILYLSASFTPKEYPGKVLFQQNCQACHLKHKTLVGPAFQGIRQDYGLNWTVNFIQDSRSMIKKRDSRALYSYYLHDEAGHPGFPTLTKTQIIQILDYVDDNTGATYTVDTTQYQHRKLSEKERQQFIKDYEQRKKSQEAVPEEQ